MKILLAEDDPIQLEPLYAALAKAGHITDATLDGETAQWLMQEHTYDLLILDWMLPKISGIDLCQQHRQTGKGTPILMLTARDGLMDRVTGLDAGADDYLVKPVNVLELLARVRALGRRSPLWTGDILHLADLQLHLATLTVQRQGVSIQLSTREFQLMEYLMRHPQQVLTRDQIERALWEWNMQPESKAVAILIHRLRSRLQPLGAETWVQTVYGMGYRLSVPEATD
ncbi:response regulator transcription factor [Thermoleptolyngbya sichuanensis A183]|uniref:Response regulator transcription factor n=1 Tax=Thermoleptolyngbya sichuanensis A183 TaxID=2737172 RepID=A0A6M8BGG9_9CYAN|nr:MULTISPECIES: response regulator transcription factor [Thermoleptolyngbya]MDG2618050.1 response regulator transcription factor [Thermoleptolyngbya sichuanensis XZ-Cy5]QKD83396.1 response regulator transcription factor [Thermoleptolyngbya sichuanensis A183]